MFIPQRYKNPRAFKVSPPIVLDNTLAISTGSEWIPPIDERFKPYDICDISNLNSDNDVDIKINNSSFLTVPRGTQRPNIGLIEHLIIKNIGTGTIAAREIRIELQNTGHEGKQAINKGRKFVEWGFLASRFFPWKR